MLHHIAAINVKRALHSKPVNHDYDVHRCDVYVTQIPQVDL